MRKLTKKQSERMENLIARVSDKKHTFKEIVKAVKTPSTGTAETPVHRWLRENKSELILALEIAKAVLPELIDTILDRIIKYLENL